MSIGKQLFADLLISIRDNLKIKCGLRPRDFIRIEIQPHAFERLSFHDRGELTRSIRHSIKSMNRLGYEPTPIFTRWCNNLLEYYGWEEYDSPFIVCLDDRFGNDTIAFTKDMIRLLDECILELSV